MPFRVTIEEIIYPGSADQEELAHERLRMTVDTLNIPAVISAINQKPRKPRTPKVEK